MIFKKLRGISVLDVLISKRDSGAAIVKKGEQVIVLLTPDVPIYHSMGFMMGAYGFVGYIPHTKEVGWFWQEDFKRVKK